jgi:signal transduction histidine kinase
VSIDQPYERGVKLWPALAAGAAVLAAGAAVWITLEADFLAYPGWLAAQKADFILGPVLIGLYWLRQRPHSRFGPILICFGFVGALYVLQSSGNKWLFSSGLLWENVVGLAAYVLILTFPTGRLDGLASKLILVAAVVLAVVPSVVIELLLPQVNAGGSISGCSGLCPENALAITSRPALADHLFTIFRYAVIAIALVTAGLLVWRFMRGTPPQRRALAIGAPVALLFLLLQATFHLLALVAPDALELRRVIAWTFAGARAALWYGFLAALVAAQLFAARALQRLVRQSLQRPSHRELEKMLREPLGDPQLRLAFWSPKTRSWLDVDGEHSLEQPTDPRLTLTVIEHSGRPAVAILHDAQLNDDPELLQTAGGIALLSAENADLDAAWNDALRELRDSRARIVRVGDAERRKVERDLHDGVQQRLLAIGIDLALTADVDGEDSELRTRLHEIGHSVDEALHELQSLARGIYPPVLGAYGIAAAFEDIQLPAGRGLTIRANGLGRYAPELESAVYYSCLEAIQNAMKYGGDAVRITVTLREHDGELEFDVSDNGPGFYPSGSNPGTGLQNIRDRLGAVDGRVSIITAPGQGTTVSGAVPVPADKTTAAVARD